MNRKINIGLMMAMASQSMGQTLAQIKTAVAPAKGKFNNRLGKKYRQSPSAGSKSRKTLKRVRSYNGNSRFNFQ